MTTTPKGTHMPGLPPPRAPVILVCELDVNGTTFAVQQEVNRALWDHDPKARAYAEGLVRRNLGERIARELNPPIRVIEHDDPMWISLTERTES
ncbi:MAG: hypothetical protein HOV70_10870 [Streptomyces sp.]|nr:hypothetical protein [Streptomyces sp.]